MCHDDLIKWRHFPRYWLFVRTTHRSPVNFPHKSQWRGALMLFFYLRRNKRFSKQSRGHYDVTVMLSFTDIYHIPFHPCLRRYADVIKLLQPVHLKQYLKIRLWSVKSISSRPYDMRGKMYSQQYAIISTVKYQNRPICRSALHYSDVIMNAMTSWITGVSICYSSICSGQRKHHICASPSFVSGIRR